MLKESISTGTHLDGESDQFCANPMEIAERIDTIAVNNVAAKEATVAFIASEQREILQDMLAEGISIDVSAVISSLSEMQRERMNEVMGDSSIVIANLPSGIAGLYDGENVVLDVNYIERGVVKHELQHQKDGLPDGLDDNLFESTGITVIDAQMEHVGSMRDILEERAMDAAGEIPEAYRHTHWATVKGLEARGSAVDVDMESANSQVVESGNKDEYFKILLEIVFKEMMKKNRAELATIIANTKDNNVKEVGEKVLLQAA